MLTRDSARTASRSELRDRPRSAARSASRGNRSPARSAPDVIMALIFSMASSVTATAAPRHRMFALSMTYRCGDPNEGCPVQARGVATVIDAHHHVLDLGVRDQDWIAGPALAPLRRNFLVADYRR